MPKRLRIDYRTTRILVVLLAVVAGLMAPYPAAAAAAATPAEILPLDQVTPGMQGVGLTVFHGQTVEEFPVEILGRLRNQVAGGDLILVRVGGRAVEEADGIAAGMSGSPVYVGGKLVGAISYGMGFADHSLGLVTPIEQMLTVLAGAKARTAASGTRTGATASGATAGVGKTASAASAAGAAGAIGAAPRADRWDVVPPLTLDGKKISQIALKAAATPILVSGLGPRATDWLNRSWRSFGLTAVRAAGGAGSSNVPAGSDSSGTNAASQSELKPGSAIGVALMRGDVEMAALGTLTYRDGGDFLALGHPLLSKGPVDLVATDAYIFTTVKSLDTPFKIGAPTDTVGRILEDRSWGVAGSFGAPPPTIPMTATVTDRDRADRVTTVKADAVNDPDLLGTLLGAAALEAMDRGIDRLGKGTARVTVAFESPGLPGGRMVRENTFCSQTDVSAAALGEFLDGVDLVLNNEFAAVNLSSVSITAEVSGERKTATVEKAVLKDPSRPIHPGDEVPILVTLRPWRGQPVTKEVVLSLPTTLEPGKVQVTVRAGGYEAYGAEGEGSSSGQAKPKPGQPPQPPQPPIPGEQAASGGQKGPGAGAGTYSSLEDLVRAFVEREHNTDLVAEFYPPAGEGAEAGIPAPALADSAENASALHAAKPATPVDSEQNPVPPEVQEREKKKGAGVSGATFGEEKPVKSVMPVEYVLDGLVFVDLDVVSAEPVANGQESK